MPAPGLLPGEGRLRDALADDQHVAQVDRQVPARVVLPVPLDLHVPGPLLEPLDLLERPLELGRGPDDPDQVVHRLLQVGLDGVGVLPTLHLERREGTPLRRLHVPLRDRGPGVAQRVGVRRGALAGTAAEHQEVGQRVPAEPVGAVHAAGALAHGVEPGHRGELGVGVDLDTAHHVVAGRPDLHRLGGDVDVGQLLELVVHRGQPAPDELGGTPRRDVEVDPAVGRSPAGLDLGVDRASDLVTGQQLGRAPVVLLVVVPPVRLLDRVGGLGAEELGDVVEHEALALGVLQDPAVTAHGLGDQQPLHRRRPDHAGRVELHELHVDQARAGAQGQRVAVAGVLPRVRGDLEGLADAAGRQHHGRRLERHEAAGLAPVAEGAGDLVARP